MTTIPLQWMDTSLDSPDQLELERIEDADEKRYPYAFYLRLRMDGYAADAQLSRHELTLLRDACNALLET